MTEKLNAGLADSRIVNAVNELIDTCDTLVAEDSGEELLDLDNTFTGENTFELDAVFEGDVSVGGAVTADVVNVTLTGAPADAGATGAAGQVRFDTDAIYVCVGTDTWKKADLATWP